MHIYDVDLNLLRVFDAIYKAGSVSRAAEHLGITQPAASQGLVRLRRLLGDALFVRGPGGVTPTLRAERLAAVVQQTLVTLELALSEASHFDPTQSDRTFRLHLSDIGEARFLPPLTAALNQCAPGIRLEARALPHGEISDALSTGKLDFALGFLPSVTDTRCAHLLSDRYVVLLRAEHPLLAHLSFGQSAQPERIGFCSISRENLQLLKFVAVRSHAQTLRILQLLNLERQVRLTTSHFFSLPAIVKDSDLGVVIPLEIASSFVSLGGYAIVDADIPVQNFSVCLHWSRRFETDPGNSWMRETMLKLFGMDQALLPPTEN